MAPALGSGAYEGQGSELSVIWGEAQHAAEQSPMAQHLDHLCPSLPKMLLTQGSLCPWLRYALGVPITPVSV